MALEPADVVGVMVQEARRQLDHVVDAIQRMEGRAEALIRFNLIVVGLTVTGVSIASTRSRLVVPEVMVASALLAMILLTASTLLCVGSYLKSNVAVGVDPASMTDLLALSPDQEEAEVALILAYQRATEENSVVVDGAALRLRWALHLLSYAIVALAGTAGTLLVVGG